MKMTQIDIATTNADFKKIADLARSIWHQHFVPIIGENQVKYMLEKFQTELMIKQQVAEGAEYFIINHEKSPVGYLSFMVKSDSLFLSKIYILNKTRGKGLGKMAMNFIEDFAVRKGLNKISLTVNKLNIASIKVYEKLGFDNVGEIVTDIGQGYVMDDYQFEKTV